MGMVLSSEDRTELMALGVDTSILFLLYTIYRRKRDEKNSLQHAKCYSAGSEELYTALAQTPDNTLPYVCVEGVTKCTSTPLRSLYNNRVGVVHQLCCAPRTGNKIGSYWRGILHLPLMVTTDVPFEIISATQSFKSLVVGEVARGVEVIDPLSAEFLDESLVLTQDFTLDGAQLDDFRLYPTVNRLFTELTRGTIRSERMLDIGVPVLGFGRLTLAAGGRLCLSSPIGSQKYILTSISKSEILHSLTFDVNGLKTAVLLMGLVCTGIATHLLYTQIRRTIEKTLFQRRLEKVRKCQQLAATNERTAESSEPTNGVKASVEASPIVERCVICVTNKRDTITLDCGHVSMCFGCSQLLPLPLHCPVCRAPVIRVLPIYIA